MPATPKKVLLLIVFLCFVSIIFLTGLRGRLFVLKSNEQKQTQSIFNKSTLKDCSGRKCVHTKMNGARSYEKFEGARNHKQLGLLKHALAFNNEKLRTTEVKESSLAIKNIVSCFSHCFLLCPRRLFLVMNMRLTWDYSKQRCARNFQIANWFGRRQNQCSQCELNTIKSNLIK